MRSTSAPFSTRIRSTITRRRPSKYTVRSAVSDPSGCGVLTTVNGASWSCSAKSTLRRIVGAPFGLPAYRWMLEPAMWALRTESELVLKSRWVQPERLTAAGFAFAHTDLEEALRTVA